MKQATPILLSLNAGYVDTAGFLALQGLFAAHITGNFVTLGMALVSGTSGVWAKILSLPVFCLIVFFSKLLASSMPKLGLPVLRTLLALKVSFLIAAAVMATTISPTHHGDDIHVIITGLLLVSAMALQNSISRIYTNPVPATILTGPLTQMMIDVASIVRGVNPKEQAILKANVSTIITNVLSFAIGCGISAVIFSQVGMWCFIVPPILAFIPIVIGEVEEFRK
jgi:uncharacterized membrane protein YoaK (UPF0700 family)